MEERNFTIKLVIEDDAGMSRWATVKWSGTIEELRLTWDSVVTHAIADVRKQLEFEID